MVVNTWILHCYIDTRSCVAVTENAVFTADYLMMKTKQQLFTAKQDYRRYQKKHQGVRMNLIHRQNVGRMIRVAVVLGRLRVAPPGQLSPATP